MRGPAAICASRQVNQQTNRCRRLLAVLLAAALCSAQPDMSGVWKLGPFSVPEQLLFVQPHNSSVFWLGDDYASISFDVSRKRMVKLIDVMLGVLGER